jgi:hypothetical protein
MRPTWIALAALLTITLMTVSCQKIDGEMGFKGPLQLEKVAIDNAISLQYGDLISVTPYPGSRSWVLWFVKPDKTIVAVAVDGQRGTIAPQALLIPRR